MPTLSVVIHTKNAASTLEKTLQSVSFADEIVVIDMNSQDETLAIAKKYRASVHRVKDVGYADPVRNFGLEKASSDWILVVDADEEIPRTLKQTIEKLMRSESETSCYYLPRLNMIFGKGMEKTGWWPDYQPRLFRKGSVSWKVGVHRLPDITGKVEYVPDIKSNAIIHHNYVSVSQYLTKLNTYTSITAQEQPQEIRSAATLIQTFREEFLRRCFAQEGIQEGMHGVGLSLLQAMYQVSVDLKRWEQSGSKITHKDQAETIHALRDFQTQLNYWIADWHVKHTRGIVRLFWRIRRKLAI